MSQRGYFDDETDVVEEEQKVSEPEVKDEEAKKDEEPQESAFIEEDLDKPPTEVLTSTLDTAFKFTISDPTKSIRGKTYPFWIYKITATTTLSDYEHKQVEVQRRFSDFVWLREQLHSTNPGVIVPPIPAKNLAGTLEKIFTKMDTRGLVDYRQRALTKFLTRVGEHSVLQKSNNLKLFLEMSFDDFSRLRQSTKVIKPKTTFFKKSLSRVPDWITEMKQYNGKLEMGLKLVRTRLNEMTKRRKEYSVTMKEFGKSFKGLGEVEKKRDENVLSTTLLDIGDKIAEEMCDNVVGKEIGEKESMQVIETITYYIGMCNAIKVNCKNLEDLRLIRDDLRHVLELREIKLKKLKITQPETHPKVVKLSSDIESLKERATEANRIMIKAEKLFKNDTEKFILEKKIDFAYMLHALANLQHEYHLNIKNSWAAIIPTINGVINPNDDD